ncbi:HET-domain-containing protein [Sporormia fimetaria CBS 119925]|uniref:HET-domain-containing protein n=1 Tax=Sporormia fimetaria CBS 119925 TaxID=1340428 RepID=A0A6A6UVA6_9PLEO|nr:HET-domain-containing protein [Sporormia fimetaria CBS 119925]
MRLLHVTRKDTSNGAELQITLREFYSEPPPYLILSHCWRDEEITFTDLPNIACDPERVKSKNGWAKIQNACRLALQKELNYAWVDTCCIMKESSAELSEAINSMYDWYAAASICVAFLDDVPDTEGDGVHHPSFASSRWFTRGWTLQELIAPIVVEFYNQDWDLIGGKNHGNPAVTAKLAAISGVPENVLKQPKSVQSLCMADRFRMACSRVTTRAEDQAYSLLGIFGVNMPPLYGEGRTKAFRRLQLLIMETSNDQTIFLWNKGHANLVDGDMLATSPDDFLEASAYQRLIVPKHISTYRIHVPRPDYTMTNAGLLIELPLLPVPKHEDLYFAFLACRRQLSRQRDQAVAICLEKMGSSSSGQHLGSGLYHRAYFDGRTVYDCPHFATDLLPESKLIWISRREIPSVQYNIRPSFIPRCRRQKDLLLSIQYSSNETSRGPRYVEAGIQSDGEPTTKVLPMGHMEHRMFTIGLDWPDGSLLHIVVGEVNTRIWAYVELRLLGTVKSTQVWNHPTKYDSEEFHFMTGKAWRLIPDYIHYWDKTWDKRLVAIYMDGKVVYDVLFETNLYHHAFGPERMFLRVTVERPNPRHASEGYTTEGTYYFVSRDRPRRKAIPGVE